jgi:hypothetical protein
MVLIRPDLDENNFVSFGNFQAHVLQHPIHLIGDRYSSIFGRAHNMIEQDRYVMTFSNQLAHATDPSPGLYIQQLVLRSKLRGMRPSL